MRTKRLFTFPRLGLAIGVLSTGFTLTSILASTASPKSAPPPLNEGATYIGETACISCHKPQNNQFSHTIHANVFRLNPKNEKEKLSCEACHGPGSKHRDDPDNPKNRVSLVGFTKEWGTPIALQNQMCSTCHQGGAQMFWEGSAHATHQLSCSDCHNPMVKNSATGLLKKQSINETCYTCHQQQRADFAKRSHMPIPEGKMSCADCHNPHGTTSKTLLKADTVNETCYTCHADKRGPFLWEHAPVRDNCLSCHNAHGSNHDKLLSTARPFLCQQCHAVANGHSAALYNASQVLGAGGNPSTRVLSHSCQNCHSQVHGSNHPAGARFQR